jgi:uncharacterized SAM-binding protein YcdF (DUF218 family)
MTLFSIFGALLEPVGLLWLLSLLATIYLIRRHNYRGALYPGLLTLVLWIVANTLAPARLVASLERPYTEMDLDRLPKCDAVVVLGGGLKPSRCDPLGFDCTSASDRFVLGLELLRRQAAPALVLGGNYRRDGDLGSAELTLTQEWLRAWGSTNAAVFELGRCATTRVEAERLKDLAQQHGWHQVLLVTSAWHMKRAEAVFRRASFSVVPVACDFRGLRELERRGAPFRPFETERVESLGCYVHERVGWLIYRACGWI